MAIILSGGVVVNGDASFSADVKIEDEKIKELGDIKSESGDTVIDVKDKYVFPGMVDVHTHLDLDTGVTKTADNFPSGTKAAIAGGTTTIVDFATQTKGRSLKEGLQEWQEKADLGAYCDYGFHMAVIDWSSDIKAEMQDMLDMGVSSFKMYMAYKDTLQVDDGIIYEALLRARELGALIGFHCENGDLVKRMSGDLIREGKTDPYYHPLSRPDTVEEEAIFRLGEIASLTDSDIWVVHLSTEKGLEIIRKLRRRGVRIVTESCPQYLLLDESRYGKEGDKSFEAAKYVISPPLRKSADISALWQGIKKGDIDFISTDHCSFNFKGQKDLGRDDFTKIPNGASGLEHRLTLLYTYGVCENKLELTDMVRLLSKTPGEYLGLTEKGSIAVGKDADIVIYDPAAEWTISAKTQIQKADYTPYEGMKAKGRVEKVFLRGEEVYSNGAFTAERPTGKFQKRKPFKR